MTNENMQRPPRNPASSGIPTMLILGATYAAFLGIQMLFSGKYREIGEGFSVREMKNQRMVYIGTQYGLARVAIDKDKDGTLDEVLQNYPISAFMGGPGYRAGVSKITEEDRRKFERANYLINLEEIK